MRFTIPTLALVAAAALPVGASAATPPSGSAGNARVAVHVSLSDAAGAELQAIDCAFTGTPADDQRDCLSVLGDPRDEIALIERAGAASSSVRVTTSDGLERTATIGRRADGSWLSRGAGTLHGGKPFEYGFVCDSAGARCVPWRATSTTTARAAVRKATVKLRRG
jgi:hypothetical protein